MKFKKMDISKRNYFKAVADAFDGSLYICSRDNKIEFVNQKVIDEAGRDVTGEFCFAALHGRKDICPRCREQEIFQGKIARWEREESQTGRWFSYTASPVYHSNGTISKLTLCTDITNRKAAENELKESKRKLLTLMSNLPGMVYRCRIDQQLTMEFASDGAYKLLGYHPSNLIGKGVNAYQKLVNPLDRERLIRVVNQALNEKRSYSFIYRVAKASGEIIWVWEQGEGVFSKEGELEALEGFITDITPQKKAELDLRKENIKLKALTKDRYKFGEIVGKSPEMQKIYELIVKAASSDVNVIIFGESGTGKELIARSIHRLSDRKDKSFVTVNCGAINENLMESEFFGHQRGAFTGAIANNIGYLDKSNGGTLFLDELGEMNKSMQVLLLRAIEQKEYVPVGGNEPKSSDFRIIAATHRNLLNALKMNDMREDFFYRINVLAIHLPPLRNRKEDLPLLIDHFVETYPGKKVETKRIPADVREAFQQYDWPGNVRELQNAVHRYLALGRLEIDGEQYIVTQNCAKRLNEFNELNSISNTGLDKTISNFEKKVIQTALEQHQWNRGKTSEFLNIDRKTLYRKIKVHGLAAGK